MCDHDFIPTETGFHFQSLNDTKAATLYCFKLLNFQLFSQKGRLHYGKSLSAVKNAKKCSTALLIGKKCGKVRQKKAKSAGVRQKMGESAVKCGQDSKNFK